MRKIISPYKEVKLEKNGDFEPECNFKICLMDATLYAHQIWLICVCVCNQFNNVNQNFCKCYT